ncbi:MAG: glycosyltransferase family A protein [Candidatus Methanoperedens sp.]|nr:glycosyltransferase family A protein [Candidatus Methanoperedens sp.]
MKKSRNYLIVTACKNEAKNLPSLIESVVTQTIRPLLWVIVDDGSIDETKSIIQMAAESYDWIHYIKMPEGERDLGIHYGKIVKTGFDYAISYCLKQGIDYSYLGNLDGDLILIPKYYENLIKEFETDSKLGIASGGTCYIINNKRLYTKVSIKEPSGGHMVLRKECFEMCNGIPLSYSIDSVLKAKAKLRGWGTRRFEENIVTEIRGAASADGYWRGFVNRGESYYYLNFNPIHVLIKVIQFSFRKPYYIGMAFLTGYIRFALTREKQIEDKEITDYNWNKWNEMFW